MQVFSNCPLSSSIPGIVIYKCVSSEVVVQPRSDLQIQARRNKKQMIFLLGALAVYFLFRNKSCLYTKVPDLCITCITSSCMKVITSPYNLLCEPDEFLHSCRGSPQDMASCITATLICMHKQFYYITFIQSPKTIHSFSVNSHKQNVSSCTPATLTWRHLEQIITFIKKKMQIVGVSLYAGAVGRTGWTKDVSYFTKTHQTNVQCSLKMETKRLFFKEYDY